jgi:Mg-chelatase subunit ChlD
MSLRRPTFVSIAIAALLVALPAAAQSRARKPAASTTDSARQPEPPAAALARIQMDDAERRVLTRLLESPHWPFRVHALLRLGRYAGPDVATLALGCIHDESWQVRCFAIREAHRLGAVIPSEPFATERDGRVIRAAMRAGVTVPAEQLDEGTKKLLRTRAIDEFLLGVEIAAAGDEEPLRREARRRLGTFVGAMDEQVAVRVSRRLARILGIAEPATAQAWREWFASRDDYDLAAPAAMRFDAGAAAKPIVATFDHETFERFIDYLDALRQRDLDLVIVMDATASMIPMVNETRAGVDSLILFLDDISRTMRLAFVAYRDHDNPPTWEGHPFTRDVASIRDFLFRLPITGGADLPEAVYDGLAATRKLEWDRKADRTIVLVGDARPHDRDAQPLSALLDEIAEAHVMLHAVHVPQAPSAEHLARLSPEAAAAYEREIAEHTAATERSFREIADRGGGHLVVLPDPKRLVLELMRLTIEESWWPAFEQFYEEYLDLCR